MHYEVTAQETSAAKMPHHIFNINVILTHLAIAQVALEVGDGSPINLIAIPIISTMVISYLYLQSKKRAEADSWFVAAHWTLAWRRGRALLISYGIAGLITAITFTLGNIFGGGMMMNDFSTDGSSTAIHEKITMFLSGVIVFGTLLVMFLQTGISVYDAGKGVIDAKIEKFVPRDEKANPELGEEDTVSKPLDQNTKTDSQ